MNELGIYINSRIGLPKGVKDGLADIYVSSIKIYMGLDNYVNDMLYT